MAEGKLLAAGKTKEIREAGEPGVVEMYMKDDLTAGNGAKHDILPGKGALANETTCNAFGLIARSGVPAAYLCRSGPRTMRARLCEMVGLEVVLRRVASGSYVKRTPHVRPGTVFGKPVLEYYLKTSGRQWRGRDGVVHTLPEDDPIASLDFWSGGFAVYDPGKPVDPARHACLVPFKDVGLGPQDMRALDAMAYKTFSILERGWRYAGGRLKDLKIEFGWERQPDGTRGRLLLADVVDNDSWRLEIGGREVSKEVYRQGGDLAAVLANYTLVAGLTRTWEGMAA